MFSWWSDLSPALRYGVAIGMIVISAIIFLFGYFWPWGFGIGIVLLLFAGPSQSEKNEYHF
ncbi:MAG: hypothetical protein KDA28_14790 [Phycisphaerales bacterium]|nr:hypothetical protein [Phycisphaerales bacterium]